MDVTALILTLNYGNRNKTQQNSITDKTVLTLKRIQFVLLTLIVRIRQADCSDKTNNFVLSLVLDREKAKHDKCVRRW